MAVILLIETAEDVCSVGIAKDGVIISLEEDQTRYTHASVLTILIERAINAAGLKSLTDIDAVAVSMGPGSYTGLRIGTAAAKGICYALNKPLIAVSTLLSMAESFSSNQKINKDDFIVPCIDARRMEVYYTMLSSRLTEMEIAKAEVIDELTFSKWSNTSFDVYFIGSGAEKISKLYNQSNFHFYPQLRPSAKGLVKTAFEKFKIHAFEITAHFEPLYLKDFVSTLKT